jgi:hypothetical protein
VAPADDKLIAALGAEKAAPALRALHAFVDRVIHLAGNQASAEPSLAFRMHRGFVEARVERDERYS